MLSRIEVECDKFLGYVDADRDGRKSNSGYVFKAYEGIISSVVESLWQRLVKRLYGLNGCQLI